MRDITINAEPVEQIKVHLVGETYLITPPKAAFALRMARAAEDFKDDVTKQMKIIDQWVDSAFGPKADEIRARMDDGEDALDITHLIELLEAVVEVQTENPTGSSPDTSPSPPSTDATSKDTSSAKARRTRSTVSASAS